MLLLFDQEALMCPSTIRCRGRSTRILLLVRSSLTDTLPIHEAPERGPSGHAEQPWSKQSPGLIDTKWLLWAFFHFIRWSAIFLLSIQTS